MSSSAGVLRSSVQQRRKDAGLASAELARRAGITRQALHNIETGHSGPLVAVALRLAQALGCRVDELFSLTPDTVTARVVGEAVTRQEGNDAITSTMSRTIITHGRTLMMVVSMLIFGGQTLHYFAVALTIGILFGIYSSVFVAAAIAMWLGVKREDLVKASTKELDPDDPNAGAVV